MVGTGRAGEGEGAADLRRRSRAGGKNDDGVRRGEESRRRRIRGTGRAKRGEPVLLSRADPRQLQRGAPCRQTGLVCARLDGDGTRNKNRESKMLFWEFGTWTTSLRKFTDPR